jgi:hypothetical protein
MAAKVFIRSADRRSTDKVKRSVADYLVRQLLAVQVSRYLYQRLQIKPTEEVIAAPSESSGPSESVGMGKLKWEPPKNKRNQKMHPWAQIGVFSQIPALPGQVRFRAIRAEQ